MFLYLFSSAPMSSLELLSSDIPPYTSIETAADVHLDADVLRVRRFLSAVLARGAYTSLLQNADDASIQIYSDHPAIIAPLAVIHDLVEQLLSAADSSVHIAAFTHPDAHDAEFYAALRGAFSGDTRKQLLRLGVIVGYVHPLALPPDGSVGRSREPSEVVRQTATPMVIIRELQESDVLQAHTQEELTIMRRHFPQA